MREILYKAKRIDNGEWVYGSYLYTFCEDKNCPIVGIQGEKHWIVEENGNIFWIDEDTICQYTGRVDKNGQKIWENDFLDGFAYPYLSDGVHNYFAEVCWCTNAPAFGIYTRKYKNSKVRGISEGFTEIMEDWKPDDWEVIGNIFDNVELLENK